MPALLVVALVVAVIWAANRAPAGGGQASAVGDLTFQVPGGGLTGPVSPAMQGGQPSNNADNNLKLQTLTQLPGIAGPQVWGSSIRSNLINGRVLGSLKPPSLSPLLSAQVPVRRNLTLLPDPLMIQNKV